MENPLGGIIFFSEQGPFSGHCVFRKKRKNCLSEILMQLILNGPNMITNNTLTSIFVLKVT